MQPLYELTNNYQQVLSMAEELDDGTLKDTLDAIQEAIDSKVENIVKVIKNLEGNLLAIQTELDRLQNRKTAIQNNIKHLKEYVQESMEATNKQKIDTGIFKINIQNHPPKVVVMDDKKIDVKYFIPQPAKLDKKQVLNDLKAGTAIEGVALQQSKSVRIR